MDNPTAVSLMDATERLLIDGGHAAVTTRHVAEEAGQAHGLIRYHFGSLNGLMVATLQRAADRILDRQRELYAGEGSFLEKWQKAMEYLETDLTEDGFPKLALELISLGWNDDSFRVDLSRLMGDFTEMLSEAVEGALEEYAVPPSTVDVTALATLIRTFQIGIMVERLAGIDVGHKALFASMDEQLRALHSGRGEGDNASS